MRIRVAQVPKEVVSVGVEHYMRHSIPRAC